MPEPDRVQRLLNNVRWDSREVRDDLRDYVIEQFGVPGGVLIVDDTGFLKKGTKSAGMQRQYSGTTGRVENCQVGGVLGVRLAAGTGVDRRRTVPATLRRLAPSHHPGHARPRPPDRHRRTRLDSGSGLAPLTVAEIRRLLAHLTSIAITRPSGPGNKT
jgi:hypothetical protein